MPGPLARRAIYAVYYLRMGKGNNAMAGKKRGPKFKYRWADWFAQDRVVLLRGPAPTRPPYHYSTSQSSMAKQARQWASHYGVSISVVDGNDHLVLLVHNPLRPARKGGRPCQFS